MKKTVLIPMSFETANEISNILDDRSRAAGAACQDSRFPRSAIGLVSDKVRLSPEYQKVRLASKKAFADLQAFNRIFSKQFAKEIRADHAKHGYKKREQPALRPPEVDAILAKYGF